METTTTKLKAGQRAWIMENNTPTEIEIYRAKVIFESGANEPDASGHINSHSRYQTLPAQFNL